MQAVSFEYFCIPSYRNVLGRIINYVPCNPSHAYLRRPAVTVHITSKYHTNHHALRLVNRALAAALVDESFIDYICTLSPASQILIYYSRMPQVSAEFAIRFHYLEPRLAYRIPQYTEDILTRLESVNWRAVSRAVIDEEFIRRHAAELDWSILSGRPDIAEGILIEFSGLVCFNTVSCRPLSLQFIERYKWRIEWAEHSAVCITAALDCSHVDWDVASRRRDFDLGTIMKYAAKWNWDYLLPAVARYDDILLMMRGEISWENVDHEAVRLSDYVLYEMRDHICWPRLKRPISDELRRRVLMYLPA